MHAQSTKPKYHIRQYQQKQITQPYINEPIVHNHLAKFSARLESVSHHMTTLPSGVVHWH